MHNKLNPCLAGPRIASAVGMNNSHTAASMHEWKSNSFDPEIIVQSSFNDRPENSDSFSEYDHYNARFQ
jgi:hypothetical protein